MKYAKYVLFGFMILFLIALPMTAEEEAVVSNVSFNDSPRSPVRLASYIEHKEIKIDNDTHFASIKISEGWDGDGSEGSPYVIKGYNITNDTTCIEIYNVSAYFIITDCLLSCETSGHGSGISLENVTHGRIENCTITKKGYGIDMIRCNETLIQNCTVEDCTIGGIVFEWSNNTVITKTNCTSNSIYGIGFAGSYNTSIMHCKIQNHEQYCVFVIASDNALVFNNTIWDAPELVHLEDCNDANVTDNFIIGAIHGVYFDEVFRCTLFNNTIEESDYGIDLYDSNECDILENTIKASNTATVRLTDSENNTLAHNDISFSLGLDTGVHIERSPHILLLNNSIYDHRGGSDGVYIGDSEYCNLTDNFIFDNEGDGVDVFNSNYTVFKNNSIYENDGYGVVVSSSEWCSFIENDIFDNNYDDIEIESGVVIDNSDYTSMHNNSIHSHDLAHGMIISDSNNCNFTGNEIYLNQILGVYIGYSDNIRFINNSIYNNLEEGIYFESGDDFNLIDNHIHDNQASGVELWDDEDSIIENNTIENNGLHGIEAVESFNILITENTIYQNAGDGIYLGTVFNSEIMDNTLYENTQGVPDDSGIHVSFCEGIFLSGNTIRNDVEEGIVFTNSDECTLFNNTIYGCGSEGVRATNSDELNITGNWIYGNALEGVALYSSNNAFIYNNTIYDNDYEGIYLEDSNDCYIINNTIYENSMYLAPVCGIRLVNSNRTRIIGNFIHDDYTEGVVIESSHNCTLFGNEIAYNAWEGVKATSSNNLNITGNWIFSNGWSWSYGEGIDLIRCNNTFIYNNTIYDNYYAGIRVGDSEDCDIIDNTIYENGQGLAGTGIHLNNANRTNIMYNFIHNDYTNGIGIESSDNCSIFHNEISWSNGWGVSILNVYNCTLFNNAIHDNNNDGIYLQNSDYCKIINNSIIENYHGVYTSECYNLYLSENKILHSGGFGVLLEDGGSITMYDNTIRDSTIDGIRADAVNNLTLEANKVHSNLATGIELDDINNCNITANVVYNNSISGIYVYATPGENYTVLENELYDNEDYGLRLRDGSTLYAVGNTIYGNRLDGIYMTNFADCTFEDNIIHNNGWSEWPPNVGSGIYAFQSHWINFTENTIFNNSEDGFHLRYSENWTIHNNTVYHNWGLEAMTCGIYLDNMGFMNITYNLIYNNTENGIYAELSHNCTFKANVIFNNTEYGIYLDDCNDNHLYLNDIGWNGLGNALDDAGDNYWNNSLIEGNFWSDYNWQETYSISGTADSIDHHPWFSLYVGVSDDIEYELGDKGNTLSWNSTAATPWKYVVYVDDSWILDSDFWDGDELAIDVDGLDVGYYEITLFVYHISGHYLSNSAFVIVVDTIDPTWVEDPENQESEFGDSFRYDLNASDLAGLDKWWLNTTDFEIDNDGVITNATNLPIEIYWIQVSVNDTNENVLTSSFKVTVEDTTDPTWDEEPQDQVLEFGESFNYDLDASDLSPLDKWWLNTTAFTIDEDGIITNAITLSVGIYAIEVYVNDTSGNVLPGTFTVTVEDSTAPTWDPGPINQEVECGIPFRYDLNATDLSAIDYWVVNDTRFSIDSSGVLTNATVLAFGEYWLTVEVHDQYDNIEDAAFRVTVVDTTPPVFVATPENVEVDEGTTVILIWNVSDLCPSSYSVLLDDELLTSGEWNSSMTFIVVAIVGLEPGEYNVTIIIEDLGDNSESDSVSVTVNEVVTPTPTTTTTPTPTPTPTTTTTTTPIQVIDPALLTIAIAGVGGGIAIIVVIVILKKSRGSG